MILFEALTPSENFLIAMDKIYFANHKKSGKYNRAALFYGCESLEDYIEHGFLEVVEGDPEKFHTVGFSDIGWATYQLGQL